MSGFGYYAYKIGTKIPSNDPADYGLFSDVMMDGPWPLPTGIIDWNDESTYPPAKKHCIAVVIKNQRVNIVSGKFTKDFKVFIDFQSKAQIPCIDIVAWVDTTSLSTSQINDAMSDIIFVKSLLRLLIDEIKYKKPEEPNEQQLSTI